MTDPVPSVAHGDAPSQRSRTHLTHVELTNIESRIEHVLRFGHPIEETPVDRHRRILSFRPDSLIAIVRRATSDLRSSHARIVILRTVHHGEPYQTLNAVRPGGEILLTISGPASVERVLQHIAAIESLGIDAATVAPDHWRHVGNRMTAGDTPRPYTTERHHAWLKRQAVMPDPRSGSRTTGAPSRGETR